MPALQIPNLKFILLFLLVSSYSKSFCQSAVDTPVVIIGQGVIVSKTSFRGLSVVSDKIIWVSGSRGTFGLSTDSGKTFTLSQLPAYAKSDFRDIEAFNAREAVMMSSGTPALILRTTDGGQHWDEVYRQDDSAYFLDAMDFWNNRAGIVIGDPINGRFVVLRTRDGGRTWAIADSAHSPEAKSGEAIFAASGTSIRCLPGRQAGFVTGGSVSRFVLLNHKNMVVHSNELPIIHGKNSQGTFSFAYHPKSKLLLFAGGDYLNDTASGVTNFYYQHLKRGTHDVLFTENLPGYTSCIEVLSDQHPIYGDPQFIATGTSGTYKGNRICTYMDTRYTTCRMMREGFHVVKKAKQGTAVFMAGSKGRIARLRIN